MRFWRLDLGKIIILMRPRDLSHSLIFVHGSACNSFKHTKRSIAWKGEEKDYINDLFNKRGRIYVLYTDGTNEDVARTDTLIFEQELNFKNQYSKCEKTVGEVILCDDHDTLIKRFAYNKLEFCAFAKSA